METRAYGRLNSKVVSSARSDWSMTMVSPSCLALCGPSATAVAMLGSPMISAFPNREVTLTRLTEGAGAGEGVWLAGAVVVGAGSRASRRAAPSSAEIVPAATWLKISRCRSFMTLIRKPRLPVCQVTASKHQIATRAKLAGNLGHDGRRDLRHPLPRVHRDHPGAGSDGIPGRPADPPCRRRHRLRDAPRARPHRPSRGGARRPRLRAPRAARGPRADDRGQANRPRPRPAVALGRRAEHVAVDPEPRLLPSSPRPAGELAAPFPRRRRDRVRAYASRRRAHHRRRAALQPGRRPPVEPGDG